jgi:uncharacterized membrane protein YraQ (UPF0718 family)
MSAFSFNLSDFVLIWWGILYEAMPFVVLGTILSGFLERCVSREMVVRFFPQNRAVGILVSACVGLIFPMCECGIVPVVRRLVTKGVPVSCAVTYMLASPIINPLVILSTLFAFRDRDSWTNAWFVTGLRVGMGFVVAVTLGLIVWKLLGEDRTLLAKHTNEKTDGHGHDQVPKGNVLIDVLIHAASDFMIIGATLVVGAAAAALINSGFSRDAMEPFAANPLAAVSGMSALAIGLNLCSEADAFVARSFVAFPLAAKMAFLVLGPMVDIKLIAMYTTIFKIRAIVAISGLTTLLVMALSITGYVWMSWIAPAGI